jgi:NTP pyrophosphatase (non-canonical NTP hydrolase)
MKDQQLKDPRLFNAVMEESRRQVEKWGVQDHSAFEWMVFLTEENGELAQAISENYYRGGSLEAVVKEAVQVATLALKIAEMYIKEEEYG